jgi:hypothetical protein
LNWSRKEIETLTKIRDLHLALANAYEELMGYAPVASVAPGTLSVAPGTVEAKSEPRKVGETGIEWVVGGESAKGLWEKSVDYSKPQYQELFKLIVTATRQPVFHEGAIYWLLQDGKTIARRKKA